MANKVWMENERLPDRKVEVGLREFERVHSRNGWKQADPPPKEERAERVKVAPVDRPQKPNAVMRGAKKEPVEREQKPNAAMRGVTKVEEDRPQKPNAAMRKAAAEPAPEPAEPVVKKPAAKSAAKKPAAKSSSPKK